MSTTHSQPAPSRAPAGVTTAPRFSTGKSIWIASEYIAQKCSFETYLGSKGADGNYGRFSTGFGLCGNTRGPLGNWATRISKITPQAGKNDDNGGGNHGGK